MQPKALRAACCSNWTISRSTEGNIGRNAARLGWNDVSFTRDVLLSLHTLNDIKVALTMEINADIVITMC